MDSATRFNKYHHIYLTLIGVIMVYPILWMVIASLTPSHEIFLTGRFLPSTIQWSNYTEALSAKANYSLLDFLINTFILEFFVISGTIISTSLVGFGFARVPFPFKKILFTILIGSLLLPQTITLIPRYILFSKLKWINSYLPFVIPSVLASGIGGTFFIFLVNQFIRSIPLELDDSAMIDGCSKFQIYLKIILPLSKTVLITVALFSFIWTWDDFQNQLIFINDVAKFTISLGLRMTIDTTELMSWGPILAACSIALLPSLSIFLIAQKYFVEGIATTGIKR
jgi:ABC-type glycerol-3-phosphate transport system permease component